MIDNYRKYGTRDKGLLFKISKKVPVHLSNGFKNCLTAGVT